MSVQIHEARRDEQSGRIDLPHGVAVDPADRRDHPVADRDIADVGLTAKAVNDGAVADEEVECHPSNLR